MQIADDVSVRVVVKGDNDTVPQCEVLIRGAPTGAILKGEVFEAAVHLDDGLIVFVSDGVPFEEGLTVALVAGDGRVLSSEWIGMMYATGVFGSLTLEPPDTVRFCFMGGGSWTATVAQRPRRLRDLVRRRRRGSDDRRLLVSSHHDGRCAPQP